MHERASTSATRGESFGHHGERAIEFVAIDGAVRPRAPDEREQLVFTVVGTRSFGHDLLRELVERGLVLQHAIEIAASDSTEKRDRLDEVVARHRKHASLRQAGDGVARAPHALQERRDAMGRPELADEIDVTDVDAEFERRGRDERAQLSVLEPRLGIETPLLRETSVMRSDGVFAETLAQMARDAFSQPS